MKTASTALLALSIVILAPVGLANTPPPTPHYTASLAPMLKKITPAVVNIAVEKEIPLGEDNGEQHHDSDSHTRKEVAVGSGVIINAKDGVIITNAHVIENAKMVLITLKNGRRYRAEFVGADRGFDIAVLRIKAEHLTSLDYADSDKLHVGNFVAAIGSPFGLEQTVTTGVISALNRSRPRIEGFQSFIQTDAPINPGNSGGALVDLNGKLVGINTAIVSPAAGNIGIGFAVPSNMVKNIVDQIVKYGKVERGMLGVIVQNMTPELADALDFKDVEGAIVTEVLAESPAAHAGLKVEDIIAKVDGTAVRSSAQMRNMLGLLRPGTKIQLSVIRNQKPIQLTATVGDPNEMLSMHELPFLGGLKLRDFSELQGDGNRITGVQVTDEDEHSDAFLAGLRIGDVITDANGQSISSTQQLVDIISLKPKRLLLKVMRGNTRLFLVVQ